MGGKALNKYGVFTERKDTSEFLRYAEKIQNTVEFGFLSMHSISVETAIVKCYHTKPSHGDLDLLVKITPEIVKANIDYRKFIDLMFLPKAIHNNGGVFSFDYQNFQIDFIQIKAEKWEIAQTYYSYDPLGNIMGKTFHKFGLSYGWDGLHYKYRNSHGTNSENILLTTDPRRIFDFGGYDYDRYLKGFDTLEDIFKFAIESKYFDTEMFQMENLKSIDKKRNRKRGSYHTFLNYLKENGINKNYQFASNKEDYLLDIEMDFPEAELLDRLHDLVVEEESRAALAERFNGELVMQWIPELKGKELGKTMSDFKSTYEDFDGFIIQADPEEIKHSFILYYHAINER